MRVHVSCTLNFLPFTFFFSQSAGLDQRESGCEREDASGGVSVSC